MPYTFMVKILYYIFVLLVVTTATLNATVRTDFRVNDDNATALQNSPRIAVAIDRTFVVTWVDRREGTSDIYIQKFDSTGQAVGVNQKINDDTNDSYQFEPAVAVELSGKFSFVWKDHRTASYPFNPEIFIQHYDSTFAIIDSNIQLSIENPLTTRETPDITLSDSKRSIIVWADYRNSNWDIFGQLVEADGSYLGANFIINDDNINAQQHRPRVSVSNQGWFVVTWYDNRFGDDDIFVQVFDIDGNPTGVNTLVNQGTMDARQAFPDVTTDGAGHFTVVWVDWRNGIYPKNPDIYSRKYTQGLIPISDEKNINTDSSSTAQREPSISADRQGNVAIIWADSIGNSWDISGQMIDVDGVIRDTNFTANSNADSAQVSPDVAIDGQNRYVTWVDRRNGNFDIYASIQEYNNPNLALSENFIQFTMQGGGTVPSAQSFIVSHLGFNPLDFTITSNMSWLNISPATSTTPDTITLLVNTDTLANGIYTGLLTFRDHTFNDTSLTIGVRLDVVTPKIVLSTDTLKFTIFEGLSDTNYAQLIIKSGSSGAINWSASENSTWLSASNYSGTTDDTIQIIVNPTALTAGTYTENFIVSYTDASGSPDTLVVQYNVVNNQPYIQETPDSIFIFTDSIINVTQDIVVTNLGSDTLNWSSVKNGSWFTMNKSNGSDNDTIIVTIDSTISFGRYTGYVQITDSNSYNTVVMIPLILDYYQSSNDTLRFLSANTVVNQTVSVSLMLEAENQLTEIHIPFQFDTTYVRLDSVIEGVTNSNIRTLSYIANNSNGTGSIEILVTMATDFLNTGSSHLAELFFTTKSVLGVSVLDSIITDSMTTYVIDDISGRFAPHVDTGFINIDVATDIDDNIQNVLPEKVELSQNYPNPFNLSTTISYALPEKSNVSLNVYNILGQKVKILLQTSQPAGIYQVDWNGHYDDGRVAPSGIYFYRLETVSDNFIKKMILLK